MDRHPSPANPTCEVLHLCRIIMAAQPLFGFLISNILAWNSVVRNNSSMCSFQCNVRWKCHAGNNQALTQPANATVQIPGQLVCGIMDPVFTTHYMDMYILPACANQLPIVNYFDAIPFGLNVVQLTKTTIVDNVSALLNSSSLNSSCPYIPPNTYSYYTPQVSVQTTTDDTSSCNESASFNFTADNQPDESPCMSISSFSWSTPMVTTMTSSRGTNWKQISLDEGAILGGIQFFLWFTSIYVL